MNQRIEGIYHLIMATHLLAGWFLARLIFDPEFGGDMFRYVHIRTTRRCIPGNRSFHN
jgi:hypothetical protein